MRTLSTILTLIGFMSLLANEKLHIAVSANMGYGITDLIKAFDHKNDHKNDHRNDHGNDHGNDKISYTIASKWSIDRTNSARGSV